MTKLKIGDLVRVTCDFEAVYEGKRKGFDSEYDLIRTDDSHTFALPPDTKLELVRLPVKVNDIITEREHLESLWIGTVVIDRDGLVARINANGLFAVGYDGAKSFDWLRLPVKVIHGPNEND